MSFCLRPNVCKKCGKPLTLFEGLTCLECEQAESEVTGRMNTDEILIVQYPFRMTKDRQMILHRNILEQKATGVILLPDYCRVITKPKDIDIQVELEPEEPSTPWGFIDCPYCGKRHYFNNEEV